MMNNNLVFALDIGTRSVVGIVAEKQENTLKIIAYNSVFHDQRTMVDGQIEDIKKVSKAIGKVKSNLEQQLSIKLNNVYIAAAGRSLKTQKITYNKNVNPNKPIEASLKNILEIDALHMAHQKFYEDDKHEHSYYCVGYSVLGYKLDGNKIANIEGHRASSVSIEIIAAFLPHIVVEGLYSCMDNNSLDVKCLTLEPIAAMNLVIPQDLRLLNIALVDIGAGTSDIAVSKDGSIIGYEMATIAGDEITESVMKNFLVDFNTAESIKVQLSDNNINEITFIDILGMQYTLEKDTIFNKIESSAIELSQEIATKILALNDEPPVAIFLIGGGSKTKNIKNYLSEFLNLPNQRIAIGSEQIVKNIDITNIKKFGPELITPIGIAYSSILNINYDFFSVIVNDKKTRLYSIRQMKVMDALITAGFDSKKLIGFSGKNLSFTLNNTPYLFKGEYSTPAEIYVNSKVANIETKINPGDVIKVIPAKSGQTPIVKISDLVSNTEKRNITLNNTEIIIGTKFIINNTEVDYDYIIGNSDKIDIVSVNTIKDLSTLYEIDYNKYYFSVNNKKVDLDYKLQENDIINTLDKNDEYLKNNQTTYEEKSSKTVSTAKNSIKDDSNYFTVFVNGKAIKLNKRKDNSSYIFTDMLNYAEIDFTKPKGKIILLLNNKEAKYTNIINEGDNIIIKWDTN